MEHYEEITNLNRRKQILDLLEEKGNVSVQALALQFSVSAMTIRRDLQFFARQGIVETHYGGAHLCKSPTLPPNFSSRNEQALQYKTAIGKKAATFLKEGDSIFLDSSTTVLQISRYFPDIHITVITNSIAVVPLLSTNPKVKLILAPGTYQEQIGGCIDTNTIEFIRHFHANKAFIGALGCHSQFGVSVSDEMDACLKHTYQEQAEQSFLMLDYSKLGKKGFFKYSDLREFDYILTNKELEEYVLKEDTFENLLSAGKNLVLC